MSLILIDPAVQIRSCRSLWTARRLKKFPLILIPSESEAVSGASRVSLRCRGSSRTTTIHPTGSNSRRRRSVLGERNVGGGAGLTIRSGMNKNGGTAMMIQLVGNCLRLPRIYHPPSLVHVETTVLNHWFSSFLRRFWLNGGWGPTHGEVGPHRPMSFYGSVLYAVGSRVPWNCTRHAVWVWII